jgi:hypothetical protein
MNIPFWEKIERAKKILLIGAGGGYDVFTGLPLYFWLRSAGKQVQLANLSSGALDFCDAEKPCEGLWRVTASTAADAYFPEMHLASWLTQRFGETSIYAIKASGAVTLAAVYQLLADQEKADTLILVDGGTDSLMRGDEVGLGTPEGDFLSLLGASLLKGVEHKYLVCLGFGIDSHHGVCHAHFLENVSSLIAQDALLGTWGITRDMEAFRFYREACEHVFARLPHLPSIVNSSIIAAVNGEFGNHHSTKRTEGSLLFINPLMSIYWAFDLNEVAKRNLVLPHIQNTRSFDEVSMAIESFRESIATLRPRTNIPC